VVCLVEPNSTFNKHDHVACLSLNQLRTNADSSLSSRKPNASRLFKMDGTRLDSYSQ
jgi:hypothetical protein